MGRTENAILDAASRHFAEYGFEGASLRAIFSDAAELFGTDEVSSSESGVARARIAINSISAVAIPESQMDVFEVDFANDGRTFSDFEDRREAQGDCSIAGFNEPRKFGIELSARF